MGLLYYFEILEDQDQKIDLLVGPILFWSLGRIFEFRLIEMKMVLVILGFLKTEKMKRRTRFFSDGYPIYDDEGSNPVTYLAFLVPTIGFYIH